MSGASLEFGAWGLVFSASRTRLSIGRGFSGQRLGTSSRAVEAFLIHVFLQCRSLFKRRIPWALAHLEASKLLKSTIASEVGLGKNYKNLF